MDTGWAIIIAAAILTCWIWIPLLLTVIIYAITFLFAGFCIIVACILFVSAWFLEKIGIKIGIKS